MSLCKRLLINVTKTIQPRILRKPYYIVEATYKKPTPIFKSDFISIGMFTFGETEQINTDNYINNFDNEIEADRFVKKLESDQCDKCGSTNNICKEIPKRLFDQN